MNNVRLTVQKGPREVGQDTSSSTLFASIRAAKSGFSKTKAALSYIHTTLEACRDPEVLSM